MKLLRGVFTIFLNLGVFIAFPVFAFHESLSSHATTSLLGEAFRIPQLAFPLVVVAGLRDSASVCTFAVMLVISAVMMSYTHDRRKALHYAFSFITAIGLSYFLIGVFATTEIEAFISSQNFLIAHDVFTLVLVGIMFIFGLLNLQDYFFGKKLWMSSDEREESMLRKLYHKHVTLWSVIKGFVSAPLLLVCTLPAYTHASLSLKSSLPLPAFVSFEALYVFMSMIPLLLMLVAMISIASHMERHDLHSGKHGFLKVMKGLFQIAAALLLLYIEV